MIDFLIFLFCALLLWGLVMAWFDEPPGPGDLQ